MDENKKEIPVSDMYLAAALVAYGGEYVRVDKEEEKRYKFIFTDSISQIWIVEQNNLAKILNPTLEDVSAKFHSGRLVFPPNYPNALRNIKSALHTR
jgi:hypothetical protein